MTASFSCERIVNFLFLSVLLLISCLNGPDEIAAEPLLIVGADYFRNYRTVPNTIEIRHNSPWQFACRWTRQNGSQQNQLLQISAPSPDGVQVNCQFSLAGRPPQCTPSVLQFPATEAKQQQQQQQQQQQSSNITCTESGNSLTCSANMVGFNPHHIGLWSCKSITDRRNDSILLQYYDALPDAGLSLSSLDPIEPSTETNTSITDNRFECFTTKSAIPPVELKFFLGGMELIVNQTKYPVEWLSNTEYSQQQQQRYWPDANQTADNLTRLPPLPPNLNLHQQLLFSSRALRIRLRRNYNGLLLECRASQELAVSGGRVIDRSVVLHLDSSDGKAGGRAYNPVWLLIALLFCLATATANLIVS